MSLADWQNQTAGKQNPAKRMFREIHGGAQIFLQGEKQTKRGTRAKENVYFGVSGEMPPCSS